jgi:hypothetical protein
MPCRLHLKSSYMSVLLRIVIFHEMKIRIFLLYFLDDYQITVS